MEKITDENFEKIINSAKPVLVDFYTDWCPPCKMLSPLLEELKEELAHKVDIVKMNIDENPVTANKFGIDRIPTVMLFSQGELKDGFIGYMDKDDIKKWIEINIL
ncbi:MAG TPA: thioredoxin [Candidatus Pacearchaeota archaeon]|nr:thioredoxin [Candidatus Pacearchaeota archaeon]